MDIKMILMNNIIKNYIIQNNTFQYTNESTENKKERFISTCNKLMNIL